jgi:hypothetical protein
LKLVPISRDRHAALRVRPLASYAAYRQSSLLPVYGSELSRAAHEFPVAFIAEKEGFFPAVLLGIEPGKNLFVALDGRWLAGYVPAMIRRAPFLLARVEESGDYVLCLDEESPLLNGREGQPLFAETGEPAPLVTHVGNFLSELERSRMTTLAACAALDRHGLLTRWDLQVTRPDKTAQKIDGLFRVEEEKLQQLGAEALVELRDTGALAVAYAHLFSLSRLPVLGQLAAAFAEVENRRAPAAKAELDLDRAFGMVEDDLFQF